jgi:hypothetical protein
MGHEQAQDSDALTSATTDTPLGTEWRTDPPSRPGWYWLRHAVFQTALGQWHEPRPTVVELVPGATGQLLVYVTGTTWTRALADLVVGEWSGPLGLPN